MLQRLRRGLALFILLPLLLSFLPCPALAQDSAQPASLCLYAQATRDAKETPLYSLPESSPELARLTRADKCLVLGQAGRYYRVRYNGTTGYVLRSKVALSAQEEQGALPLYPGSDVTMDSFVLSIAQAKELPLKGDLRGPEGMDTLFFFLWDDRQQTVEASAVIPLSSPASEVKASSIRKSIAQKRMSAGRKTLVLQGAANGERYLLYQAPLYVCGNFDEVRSINDQCAFFIGGSRRTGIPKRWEATKAQPSVEIRLPREAALVTVEWQEPPKSALVEYLDENGAVLSVQTLATGFYADSIPLTEQTSALRLTPEKGAVVRRLRVYDGRYPENAVQQWQSVPEKLDLMVFSAHQDDELLFLGGTIPYACALGKATAVVYMTNGGRSRYAEALDGLWTAGLRAHPIFLGWRDQKVNSLKTARNTWEMNGNDPVGKIAALIRQYRPDVIVTQDWDGEYGHTQHKLTARLVAEAVEKAADPAFHPESAEEYGAWQVKKLYLHLYAENSIVMDWDMPLDDTGVITPMFLAKEAYDKHRSQQKAYAMDREGRRYKNNQFGLYYTAVGPDEAKNDFFEHLD